MELEKRMGWEMPLASFNFVFVGTRETGTVEAADPPSILSCQQGGAKLPASAGWMLRIIEEKNAREDPIPRHGRLFWLLGWVAI